MSSTFSKVGAPPRTSAKRLRLLGTLKRLNRSWYFRVGFVLFAVMSLIALLGPLFAPHTPTEIVGIPYSGPSDATLLGCDFLGRDALSRFLYGGRTVIALSAAATGLGLLGGIFFGLIASYSAAWVDDLVMRALDVLMAFPPIIFALLVVSMLGPKLWLLVTIVAIGHAPRVARLVRGAALEVIGQDFISESEALGEKRSRILVRGVLPNISSPLLVETALRFTYSIGIIASLSFMGFGLQPPAADWGLMINENRGGIVLTVWPVLLPIVGIAVLAVGSNLMADGFARVLIGIGRAPGRN